jgi:hypothetical protein
MPKTCFSNTVQWWCSGLLYACFACSSPSSNNGLSLEQGCALLESTLHYTGCVNALKTCTGSEAAAFALGGGEALPCDAASLAARNVSGEACSTPSAPCNSAYVVYKATQQAPNPALCEQPATYLTRTFNTETNKEENTCMPTDPSRAHCTASCSCTPGWEGPQCDVFSVQNTSLFPSLSNGHYFPASSAWESNIPLPNTGFKHPYAVMLPWIDTVVTPGSNQTFNLGTPALEIRAVFDDESYETVFSYTYNPSSHEERRNKAPQVRNGVAVIEHVFQQSQTKTLTHLHVYAVHIDIASTFTPHPWDDNSSALLQVRVLKDPYKPTACNGLGSAQYNACSPLAQYCGDGVVQTGETCDYGHPVNGRPGNACAANCVHTCNKRLQRTVFTLSHNNSTLNPIQAGSFTYTSRFIYGLDYAPREWADGVAHTQNSPDEIAWHYLRGFDEPFVRSCNGEGNGKRMRTQNKCLYAVKKWFVPTENVWGHPNKASSLTDFSVFAKADNHLSFMLLGPDTSLNNIRPQTTAYVGVQNTCGTIYQKTDTLTLTHDEVCAPITP